MLSLTAHALLDILMLQPSLRLFLSLASSLATLLYAGCSSGVCQVTTATNNAANYSLTNRGYVSRVFLCNGIKFDMTDVADVDPATHDPSGKTPPDTCPYEALRDHLDEHCGVAVPINKIM